MQLKSLGVRVVFLPTMIVLVVTIILGIILWQILSGQAAKQAVVEAEKQRSVLINNLNTIDDLTRQQVQIGMRVFQSETKRVGAPSVHGTVQLGSVSVPNLFLGASSIVGDYALVDHVKELAGGTATFFAWDGTNFTRISTNVLKADNSRAVGTVLDPKGKAYAALSQGQTFTGVVEILGTPYTTSYVPILDHDGKMIGAWYTGYKLNSIASLSESIQHARILKSGFIALLKPSGALVFSGDNVSEKQITGIRAQKDGWVAKEETFPAWGYTILTAYRPSDITEELMRMAALIVSCGIFILGLIVVTQSIIIRQQVLKPVQNLTCALQNADLNTRLSKLRDDEIGEMAGAFNQFVTRMREVLIELKASFDVTYVHTNNIQKVAESNGQTMEQQQCSADAASNAISELADGISSISSITQEANQRAKGANDAADQGRQQVDEAVHAMENLTNEASESAEKLATLTSRAHEISKIVGVIEEIAAGTNLLALNASIEAARAGEHGRGFAVVAGEVRRLAERTAQATQQVGSLIRGIEEQTETAVSSFTNVRMRVSEGSEQIKHLNSTFERINTLASEVSSSVDRIANAAEEKVQFAASATNVINELSSSARQGKLDVGEVLSGTSELLANTQSLKAIVDAFNLRHD